MNVYLHIEDIFNTDKSRVTILADGGMYTSRDVLRDNAYTHACELLDMAFGVNTSRDALREIEGETGAVYPLRSDGHPSERDWVDNSGGA